jgi:predicted small lipoprotein YifL
MSFPFSRTAACLMLAVCLSGCGQRRPETFPTAGRVEFSNGQPVRLGTVELLSDEHKVNAIGTIRNNGTFVLGTFTDNDGAVSGMHRVIVTQLIVNDLKSRHVVDHGSPVDPLFGSYTTSPLTVTIQAGGPNEITLTVEKARPK